MTDHAMPPTCAYELAYGDRAYATLKAARYRGDGTILWAIYEDENTCLLEPGLWGNEPRPSNREEGYLARTRHDIPAALELWRRHLVVALSGGTWGGYVAGGVTAERMIRLYDPWRLADLIGVQEGRPRLGSWIPESLIALGPPPCRDDAQGALMGYDVDFRRGLALAADDWHRAGRTEVPVAGPDGFAPDVHAALLRTIDGSSEALLAALCAALHAFLGAGAPFPVGLATLVRADGSVRARVLPRRPGVDLPGDQLPSA